MAHKFQDGEMVSHSTVNADIVGSNPTPGA